MKENKKANDFIRFLKFTVFSVSAGVIETVIFYLLGLISSFGYWACYLPALVASVIWNFTLNRRFTFQSAANIPCAMLKTFAYYAVFTPLSTVVGDRLAFRFAAYPAADDIIYFTTLLFNFITEFLYQRYYVWVS